jgi:tetratricopeptide (TPR) repeat protein
LEARRYDEAATLLQRALSRDPRNSEVRIDLGRAWLHTGRYKAAARELQKAIDRGADTPRANLYLGDAVAGRIVSMDEAMRRALHKPREPNIFARLFSCMSPEKPLPPGPDLVRRRVERARAANEAFVNRALAAYDRAIDLDASLHRAWAGKAEVLEGVGRRSEAMAAWHAATQAEPEKGRYWASLGSIQLRRHHFPEAVKSYERALRLEPRDDWQTALISARAAIELAAWGA